MRRARAGGRSKASSPPLKTGEADGRPSLDQLYRFAAGLGADASWEVEVVCVDDGLPVQVLRTRRRGPAVWLLAGIHGEEPAPPVAVSRSRAPLDALAAGGIPVVLFPLCNPTGYAANRRYPDGTHSVGDSEHLLPGPDGRPRAPRPACPQADALTRRVIALARDYPPVLSVDLHEDDHLEAGYVYSQGRRGVEDPAAQAVVRKLRELGEPVVRSGTTRFGEAIVEGVVSGVRDGSVDELVAADRILVDGAPRPGPAGRSVVVVESSSQGAPLERRIRMHRAVIEMVAEWFALARAE